MGFIRGSVILCYFASGAVQSLKCFTCSHHKGTQANSCPTSSSDRSAFEKDRLEEVDPGAYYCSLRIAGNGEVWHQGFTPRDDCNSTDVISHITSLVNKDAGVSGAKFICCGEDGCNWSEALATDNVSILETALPFIIAGIIALAILVICCAVCCGTGCCTLCGCLGCCCTEEADKVKVNKSVNKGYQEQSININERYRTLARPASEASATTGLTPVGSPQAGGRANQVASGQEATGEAKQVSVEASQGEDVKNVNANKFESVDGVPNPNDVENDRITRTARYYFQPAHLNQ